MIVEGARGNETRQGSASDLRRAVEERVAEGASRRDAIRDIARRRGLSRRAIYRLSHPKKETADTEEE